MGVMAWDMPVTDIHMLLVLDIMDIILARDLPMPNQKQRLTPKPGMVATDMAVDTMVVIMAVDTMVVTHTDTDTEDTGVKHIMSIPTKNTLISQQEMFSTLPLQENFGFDIINCDKM